MSRWLVANCMENLVAVSGPGQFSSFRARSVSHRGQFVTIFEKPFDLFGNRLRYASRDKKPGFAFVDQIFAAGVSSNDEREPARHRFLLNQGAAFHDRWQHEHVARAHELQDSLV